MSRTAIDVVVTGHVQGVYFRAEAEATATRLGLAGWVSNTPDGSVQLHAEGDPDAVERLVEWCRTGPPRARVDDVRTSPGEDTGASGFEVR